MLAPSVSDGAVSEETLNSAVVKELNFLRQVDDFADVLYDEEIIRLSAMRYERLWIPAVESRKPGRSPDVPPLDIAFIWHCHALCPTRC